MSWSSTHNKTTQQNLPHVISPWAASRLTGGLIHCLLSFMRFFDSAGFQLKPRIIIPGNIFQFPVLSWQWSDRVHPAVFCCSSRFHVNRVQRIFVDSTLVIYHSHVENCHFFHRKSQRWLCITHTGTSARHSDPPVRFATSMLRSKSFQSDSVWLWHRGFLNMFLIYKLIWL